MRCIDSDIECMYTLVYTFYHLLCTVYMRAYKSATGPTVASPFLLAPSLLSCMFRSKDCGEVKGSKIHQELHYFSLPGAISYHLFETSKSTPNLQKHSQQQLLFCPFILSIVQNRQNLQQNIAHQASTWVLRFDEPRRDRRA